MLYRISRTKELLYILERHFPKDKVNFMQNMSTKELLQGVVPFLSESEVNVFQNKPIEGLKHFLDSNFSENKGECYAELAHERAHTLPRTNIECGGGHFYL